MAKVSVEIIVPTVGKSLNLLVPKDISCAVLLEMAIEFSQDRFQIPSNGDLYLADTGEKVSPRSSFKSLGNESALSFVLM